MNRSRIARIGLGLVVATLVFLGAGFVLIKALESGPVKFRGKEVERWAEDLKSSDPAVRGAATNIVLSEIIPALTNTMFNDTNDSAIVLSLVDGLNSLPGIMINHSFSISRRSDAVGYLGSFGADAAPAIPALLEGLKSKEFPRSAALSALGEINLQPEIVIPILQKFLDDDVEDVKGAAIEALGEFGPLAKAAGPKLVTFLKYPSKELPFAAQKALKKIDPELARRSGVK